VDTVPFANFDLSSGVVGSVGSGATASIVNVGNGWYRCVVVITSTTATTPVIQLVPASTSARGAASTLATTVFLWGAQMEVGITGTPTTYTRNNGGVFPPRFDYDPVTLAPKGILIEEQRTNLLTYSEQFDNAAWFKSAGSVTANTTTSPDGTVDADAFIEDTSTGTHIIRFQPLTVTSGTTYTAAVYVKANGRNRVRLINFDGVTSFVSIFNLSTGTVASGTGTIISVGNGWYRITQTFASASTVATNFAYQISLDDGTNNSYTGDGTSGIFIYGAQLEAGAFATSYIPTVASQVTRAADQTSIVAPNFAPWYNQSEGTFVCDFDTNTLNASATSVYASVFATDGTANNFNGLYNYGNFVGGAVRTGNVTQADINGGGSPANNTTIKSAIAYATNDIAVTVNGATPVTDTSAVIGTTMNQLTIGNRNNLNYRNGHIRSIRYYPTRLSNAQLQALTA